MVSEWGLVMKGILVAAQAPTLGDSLGRTPTLSHALPPLIPEQTPGSSALGAGPAAAVLWPSCPWLVPVPTPLTTELGGVLVFFWESSPS